VALSWVFAASEYVRVTAKGRGKIRAKRVSPRGHRGRDSMTALQSRATGRGPQWLAAAPGQYPEAETVDPGCRLSLGLRRGMTDLSQNERVVEHIRGVPEPQSETTRKDT
jgi:hypothetical protein